MRVSVPLSSGAGTSRPASRARPRICPAQRPRSACRGDRCGRTWPHPARSRSTHGKPSRSLPRSTRPEPPTRRLSAGHRPAGPARPTPARSHEPAEQTYRAKTYVSKYITPADLTSDLASIHSSRSRSRVSPGSAAFFCSKSFRSSASMRGAGCRGAHPFRGLTNSP